MNFIRRNEKGVVSLEACIVVPIFSLVVLFLYGFIIMFSGQQVMSHALIQCAESLSLDPYSTQKLNLSELEGGGDLVTSLYAKVFTEGNDFFSSTEKWYENNDELMMETVKKRFYGFLAGSGSEEEIHQNVNEMLDVLNIEGGINGLDFSETKIENGILMLKVKYKQGFLFDFQGLASFDRKMEIKVKLWNGETT